jgi:hypothetical protein
MSTRERHEANERNADGPRPQRPQRLIDHGEFGATVLSDVLRTGTVRAPFIGSGALSQTTIRLPMNGSLKIMSMSMSRPKLKASSWSMSRTPNGRCSC